MAIVGIHIAGSENNKGRSKGLAFTRRMVEMIRKLGRGEVEIAT